MAWIILYKHEPPGKAKPYRTSLPVVILPDSIPHASTPMQQEENYRTPCSSNTRKLSLSPGVCVSWCFRLKVSTRWIVAYDPDLQGDAVILARFAR